MKEPLPASLVHEKFLPVTVYEPHQCEHPGCIKLGLFGFLQRHEQRWFCYGHRDIGELSCQRPCGATN